MNPLLILLNLMIKIFRDKAIRTNNKINSIIKFNNLEVTAKIDKVYN